ncbi:glycosyltransferase family 4 protein [Ideonella sp. A 288]|uniref:glycosyltransferase family 4 protein n=1 Tax=Ideonella sp. A 288 TaxID=1962181 RepID=UPI000B4AEFA2|nr:glycosyltransferase family 4 protein [Ideonella sp. A 288]
MASAHRRVCFVAPMAWPVLARDRTVPVVGGAEVQQVLLARELARRGHAVSMVCLDHGQPDGVVVDGVRVWRMHAPGAGWPVLRFLHPGLSSVWRAMRRADAEVYYQRSAGAMTAFVVAFARWHRRRSVFASAADPDFAPELPWIRYGRDRALYRWAVRQADAVVVQTARQHQACRAMFARQSSRIPSCHPKEAATGRPSGDILWVGTVKPLKRPELLVELARRLPEFRFRLVGGGSAADVQALAADSGLPNLQRTGFVPHADVGAQFDGASVLVNTSVAEGFPNTFLQAWSRGVPSLAFFDPEVQVDGAPVSEVAASLDDMVQRLRRLKTDAAHWQRLSERSRRCAEQQHSVASAVDAYEQLFDGLVCGPVPHGRAGA